MALPENFILMIANLHDLFFFTRVKLNFAITAQGPEAIFLVSILPFGRLSSGL